MASRRLPEAADDLTVRLGGLRANGRADSPPVTFNNYDDQAVRRGFYGYNGRRKYGLTLARAAAERYGMKELRS